MHKDIAKGAAKDASGSIKEAAGKLTGNERLEAEGVGEPAAPEVQKGVAHRKDAPRGALKN